LLLLLLLLQVSQIAQDPSRAYAFSSIQMNDKVSKELCALHWAQQCTVYVCG
jgi:hypothetical protein